MRLPSIAVLAAVASFGVAHAQDIPASCQEAFAAVSGGAAPEQTVERFTACLDEPDLVEPGLSQVHVLFGAFFLEQGDRASALTQFDEAEDVPIAGFYIDRADLRSEAGRSSDALADLETAKTLAANDIDELGILRTEAGVLARAGRYDEALAPAQRLVELHPDEWSARLNLGGILQSLGRTDEALVEAEAAIALQPDHFATHNSLCYALVTSGDPQAARPSCERALELGPEVWQVVESYAAMLAALGETEEARAQYERAITLAPPHQRPTLEESLSELAPQ